MPSKMKGFTLVEMLVVVLIIGILLGITLLSPITGSIHKTVQDQSARLEVLFSQVRDKALLENVEYGFSVQADGSYQWWLMPLESREWVMLNESPLQSYKLPSSLSLWLEVAEEVTDPGDDEEFEGPVVVFYSDRQATPFKLHIEPIDDPKQSVVLVTDGLSDVEVTR
ncbi:hypothetical protein ACH42_12800 [Endozoicomonas sp. (ex Bugula neritina AB1)]|nr:hypothetical protein ACH42_12800 [Endozoicomonas sp. (ex Bugula neritina AB1)]